MSDHNYYSVMSWNKGMKDDIVATEDKKKEMLRYSRIILKNSSSIP